jgi:hypothetical protein
MTSTGITAPGLSGVLRMIWLHDDLAHVLEHADVEFFDAWHVFLAAMRDRGLRPRC